MVEKNIKSKAEIARESRQTRRQLVVIKQGKEKGLYPGDSFYEGPVLITELITNQLKMVLNMGQDTDILRELNLAQHTPQEDPYVKAIRITEEYLSLLSRDDDTKGTKGFLHQLGSQFEKEYPSAVYPQHQYIHNAAAIGAVLVLKAFEMQLGESFFDNMKKITPREMLEAFTQRSQLTTNHSLVEKARSGAKIPENGQIFLKPFMNEFTALHCGVFAPHVEYGATLTFSVIDKLWHKLKPQ